MLSSAAEEKLDTIAKRICQWHEDYFHDNLRLKSQRETDLREGAAALKKFQDRLPAKLSEMKSKREAVRPGAGPDIMTTIKHMRELTDMVLTQHKVAAIAPPAVAAKQSNPKNKTAKKERCPNGTKRNATTGKCEAK
jgi:hypothetical protein